MKRDTHSFSATRHVARRTKRGRKAYVVKSLENSLEIRLESQDEVALVKLLDIDPRGSQLRAQAETFDLSTGDVYQALPLIKACNSRYYTPDLTNVITNIKHVYEVKPVRFRAANEALFEVVEAFCLSKGMKFVVLSKEDFGPTLLNNISLLHQFGRQCQGMLDVWAQEVDRLTEKTGNARDVLKGLVPSNYYLIAALMKGVLKTDLRLYDISTMNVPVEPAYGELRGLEFLTYE
tara:strand:- start:6968 stop:7672 length:705 start_codon:yes stop_codon:yes gene_type:complete